MNANTPTKQQLLQQISEIDAMERGKLSAYSFQERTGAAGPYHKLQHWENGKNQTRYIPAQDVPAIQAALVGYARFEELTEQYAQLVIDQTRQNLAGSKKKKSPKPSGWPKRKKSSG